MDDEILYRCVRYLTLSDTRRLENKLIKKLM